MADRVVSEYDLNILPFLSKMDSMIDKSVELNELLKNNAKNDPFREATKGAQTFEKNISANTGKVAELEAITAAYKEEVQKLNSELSKQEKILKSSAGSASKQYKQNQTDIKALKEEIKRLNAEITNTSKKGKEATGVLSRMKGALSGAFAGFASGGGAGVQGISAALGAINPALGIASGLLGGLATKAFDATAQWQGYTVALKNSLGSQELANQNLSVLEQLAVKLPVGLNEVTEAFNQLVNRGFKPTKDELSNLSGFAAAQNKTFDQLIQAILDAEQGELERLKEFGFESANVGNKVNITFRGITKSFEKGARDSATAFADLARELGSDKLNADKMQTLAGRMSNLGDQADSIARKFGEVLLPTFEAVLSITSKLLDFVGDIVTGYNEFNKALDDVGKTSGGVAYPAIKALFDLFSNEEAEQGRSGWERLFFSLRAGFEKVAASAELLVAVMTNLSDPVMISQAVANYKRNLDVINKAIQDYQSSTGQAAAGDFQYGANGVDKPRELTEAEKKLIQKRATELKALEEKLANELIKLEQEYGKEKLEALKDNELEYIEAKKKFDLAKIDQEEKALLKLKQIVSGARKGQYDINGKIIPDQNAQLSATESAPFEFRRQLVDEEAAKDRAKFINDAEKEITGILSKEYQRQLQSVERKYEDLFKLAQKSGVDIKKLEEQKQKEIRAILLDKSLADIEKKQLQETGDAETNVIRAQISGRVDLELQGRRGLIEIEKKFTQQKIDAIEASGDEEADARVRVLKNTLAKLDLEISDITSEERKQKGLEGSVRNYLIDSLGLSKDETDAAIESAELFADKMTQITSDLYNTLNKLSQQRIDRINDEISKKEEQVEKEQELNEEGVANNLDLRLKELADLKKARERALEDQKRLQRTQAIVDTATQASAMITASSKVFAGFSSIPIVGVGLGIAAVALMLGAFAAAKIKSFQLINQQAPQFGDGGDVGGNLHRDGGTLIEAERGEYVVNRRSTAEHHELIEAINHNNKSAMMDYLLTELLDGTGVTMNDVERRRQMMFISSARKSTEDGSSEVVRELAMIKAELKHIKESTSHIAPFTTTPMGNGVVLKENNKTGSKELNDISAMIK